MSNLPSNLAARLIGRSGDYRDNEVVIKGDDFLIGRSIECHLVLNEGMVSSKHAKILRSGDEFEVQDLNSTNGTFVNDERIEKKALRTGDVIKFGPVAFEFVKPFDSTRTIVATPENMAAMAKSRAEAAKIAAATATPPHPKEADATMSGGVKVEVTKPSRPRKAGGGLIVGVIAGLVLAFGLPLLAGVLQMNNTGTLSTDGVVKFLENWASGFPGMNTHEGWKLIGVKTIAAIVVLLGLVLGPLFGGMIAQIRGGRKRPVTALLFSLLYCAAGLLIQIAVTKFAFGSWAGYAPPIVPSLGSWGNFAAAVAYFFGVVFVLSFIGTLVGKARTSA